jgi:23S rRNA pseudouridine2605 synthase
MAARALDARKPLIVMLVRLQKFLAEAGVASRRASEEIIVAGRVTVNGSAVKELGTKVRPGEDKIAVDGQPVKARRKLYLALHKPPGYICSRNDPEARRVIGELLPKEWNNLYTVGRLDKESEGLIFLTNDGEFSLRLTHPRYGARKIYSVIVEGRVQPATLQRFVQGVKDGEEVLKAQSARIISGNNTRSVVEVVLTGGKNREIRRLFETAGLVIVRLQRVQIGRIKLGELPAGKWRTLTEPEIKSLLSQI